MKDLGTVDNVHEDNIELLRILLKPDIMGADFSMLLKAATLEDILKAIEWVDETNEDDKPTEQELEELDELLAMLRNQIEMIKGHEAHETQEEKKRRKLEGARKAARTKLYGKQSE